MYCFTLLVMTVDYAQMLFSRIPFLDLNTSTAKKMSTVLLMIKKVIFNHFLIFKL